MIERKAINPFLNSDRQLRSAWWIVIFFLILASLLVPIILLAQQEESEVSIGLQAILIAAVSGICQLLRRRPLTELLGKINLDWFRDLSLGVLFGFGVSGTNQTGLFAPAIRPGFDWLTGGSFGLEASALGLIGVVAALILLYVWKV